MASTYHPPVEEYLETIYSLEEEGTRVIQARLAERLGHAPPTVYETVRRLEHEGFVAFDQREIGLTATGRALAEGVVRKHRLAERLLTDVIGLPWHEAHREAGRWEHVISDEVEQLLARLLGNPSTCPHGNPIPGMADSGAASQVTLDTIVAGDVAHLARVPERVENDDVAMSFLAAHGLVPGAALRIIASSDDDMVTVEVAGDEVGLERVLAAQLYVTTG